MAGARWAWLLGALLLACSSEEHPASEAAPARKLVTADWMNRSLSVFDLDAVVEGRADGPAYDIALDAWAPGPVEVEVAPDGVTALVAVGPAFLDGLAPLLGFPEVPAGGALLVVDLQARRVRAEIGVSSAPVGLAIGPDGKRAFAALFGETSTPGHTLAVVDLEQAALIDEIDFGQGRPEQVTLDAAGGFGLVSVDGEGVVYLFDAAEPSSMSPPISTSTDPSDVAFVEGTGKAVVANSIGNAGYTVFDVSTPLAPSVLESVTVPGNTPYGATAIPGSTHVLLTQSFGFPAALVRVDVAPEPSTIVATHELSNQATDFALGVAVNPEGTHAFVALPADRSLSVVDLDDGSARALRWLDAPGPTYAAIGIRPDDG